MADTTEQARWYCVDREGVAMLCKDGADARAQAMENDACWPARAPHRAVMLGDVAGLHAELRHARDGLTKGRTRMREDNARLIADRDALAAKLAQARDDDAVDLAAALEIRAILEEIKEVARVFPLDDMPTPFQSAWRSACEEIFFRATGRQWHMDEDDGSRKVSGHTAGQQILERALAAMPANEPIAALAQEPAPAATDEPGDRAVWMKAVRLAWDGDKEGAARYVELAATKLEQAGEASHAKYARMMLAELRGERAPTVVHPASAPAEPVAWRYRYSTRARWNYADESANGDPAVEEQPLHP